MIVYRGEQIRKPFEGREYPCGDDHWHKLPCPGNDGLTPIRSTEWCAATSKKTIFKWWQPKKHHMLLKAGMKIFVLSIPKEYVKKGYTQCLINRHEAQRIGELLPTGEIKWDKKYLAQKESNTSSRRSSTTNVAGS